MVMIRLYDPCTDIWRMVMGRDETPPEEYKVGCAEIIEEHGYDDVGLLLGMFADLARELVEAGIVDD